MSFRRSKRAAHEAQRWRAFLEANADLFQRSGVPLFIYQSRELFDDLLMHGYIDHHDDPTRFAVGQLSAGQLENLIEVVGRYLRAGFPDPGVGGFMGGPTRTEIFRRAGLPDPWSPTSSRR
jgi:hypothetical protein